MDGTRLAVQADMPKPLAPLLLALLTGCAVGEETFVHVQPLPDLESKIVNGVAHAGDPGVVYLSHDTGACTGTLIHRGVVLTAKHCVENITANQLSIGVGADMSSGRIVARVRKIHQPPGALGADGSDDIALLVLDRSVDVATYRWVEALPEAQAGARVVGIGYGLLDLEQQQSAGTKRRAQVTIADVNARTVDTTALGCYGDSGGPLFLADGRVWGVLATFDRVEGRVDQDGYADCDKVESRYSRTDIWKALIEQAIADAEGGGGDQQQDPAPNDPPAPGPNPDPDPRDDGACNGRQNVGLACGGADGQMLTWCDEAGQAQSFHCANEGGGANCASDLCTAGPWCCLAERQDDAPAPEGECGGRREQGLGCGGNDGQTLRWCDEFGQAHDFHCPTDGQGAVCASDRCAAGAWCCPPDAQQQRPPDPDPGQQGDVPGVCDDRCPHAGDGECDDGGPGAMYAVCPYGSDCRDCGARDGGDPWGGDPGQQQGGGACSDACAHAGDGECDDGGPGAMYAVCAAGTDCWDCGPR